MNRRRQLGIADDQRLVGYISSSIFSAKGLEHFVLMAVAVAQRFEKAVFLIVGNPVDTDYFEQCLNLAREQNVIDRFRWIRFEEQIETIYPAMDVLVVPSMTPEGFGMTALEGMVFGKPVVVYGSGGLAEIANATGNSRYIVETGNVDGLFQKVSGLLGDEMERAVVGERNARMAVSAFGIAAYRERIRKLIDLLAGFSPVKKQVVRGTAGTVYLLEDGILRPFASEEAFLQEGYRFEEVKEVPDAMLAALPHGMSIGRSSKKASIVTRKRKTGRRRRGRRRKLL
ncbi:glycosyltransferase, partial [Paenibacillus sepulcri]|nr:glycosyltransferase [Paenibacillus sepulcri]